MTGSTYANFAAFNADVERARQAYTADQAVRSGLCAACHTRPRYAHARRRRCLTCRSLGLREKP